MGRVLAKQTAVVACAPPRGLRGLEEDWQSANDAHGHGEGLDPLPLQMRKHALLRALSTTTSVRFTVLSSQRCVHSHPAASPVTSFLRHGAGRCKPPN